MFICNWIKEKIFFSKKSEPEGSAKRSSPGDEIFVRFPSFELEYFWDKVRIYQSALAECSEYDTSRKMQAREIKPHREK